MWEHPSNATGIEADVRLSSKGFKHVPLELHDGDFEFIVGDQTYKCNSIVAEFLSPKISRLRQSDPSLFIYRLETEDCYCKFSEFLSLAFDSSLHVASENFNFFVSVSRELENEELFSQLVCSYISSTELTKSNAVKLLCMKQHVCSEGEDERELSFIASNFSEIEDLSSLEIPNFRRLLSHSSFRIESEDWLYNFISSLISNNESFSELLEFVHFEFLNDDSIEHFIKTSPSFIFSSLNLSIWNSLCCRLSQKVLISKSSCNLQEHRFGRVVLSDEIDRESKLRQQFETELSSLRATHSNLEKEKSRLESELRLEIESLRSEVDKLKRLKEFKYNGSNDFDGIISHLKRECGGNVHSKGVVNITASSTSYNQCHQLVDYGWNSYWYSSNSPNQWVCFDFKDKQVCLSGYTLRSDGEGGYLRRWSIEVSNDGSSWSSLDSRDTTDLCSNYKVKNYSCSNANNSFYRFIRIRQTGKNNGEGDCFHLSEIEFFGKLL